jgi:hypothetical protein
MRSLNLERYALCSGMAAAILTGCGGSQPPIGAPGAMPQSRAVSAQAKRAGSWMAPGAASQDLLYVTDYNVVNVFSYPEGKLVGTLKGFNSAVGACVDSKGDVYVPAYSKSRHKIAEYVHGGSKPIAELMAEGVSPVGCSIDPTTGDLAASGFGEPPTINVFKAAKGQPLLYKPSGFVETQFCA